MSDPVSNIEGDIRVNGTLSCDGDLIIDGQLEGELSVKGNLTITEIGDVGADTEASQLTVAGKLKGKINAKKGYSKSWQKWVFLLFIHIKAHRYLKPLDYPKR